MISFEPNSQHHGACATADLLFWPCSPDGHRRHQGGLDFLIAVSRWPLSSNTSTMWADITAGNAGVKPHFRKAAVARPSFLGLFLNRNQAFHLAGAEKKKFGEPKVPFQGLEPLFPTGPGFPKGPGKARLSKGGWNFPQHFWNRKGPRKAPLGPLGPRGKPFSGGGFHGKRVQTLGFGNLWLANPEAFGNPQGGENTAKGGSFHKGRVFGSENPGRPRNGITAPCLTRFSKGKHKGPFCGLWPPSLAGNPFWGFPPFAACF